GCAVPPHVRSVHRAAREVLRRPAFSLLHAPHARARPRSGRARGGAPPARADRPASPYAQPGDAARAERCLLGGPLDRVGEPALRRGAGQRRAHLMDQGLGPARTAPRRAGAGRGAQGGDHGRTTLTNWRGSVGYTAGCVYSSTIAASRIWGSAISCRCSSTMGTTST